MPILDPCSPVIEIERRLCFSSKIPSRKKVGFLRCQANQPIRKGWEGLFNRSENLNMIPDRIAFIENIEKSRIYQIDCAVFFHIIYNVYGFYSIRNISQINSHFCLRNIVKQFAFVLSYFKTNGHRLSYINL